MKATQSTDETWLPVVGYETTHQVSNLGQVRRLPRLVLHSGKRVLHPLRELQGNATGHIYRRVTLAVDGARDSVYVHQLVAAAFIGPRPPGMEVCHNNGDPLDNRSANLRYDTPSANRFDTVRHGNNKSTHKTHCPKGHAYTEDNTAVWSGRRNCRTCKRAYNRKYKRRLRDQRRAARLATTNA